jgi:hypothetical protein
MCQNLLAVNYILMNFKKNMYITLALCFFMGYIRFIGVEADVDRLSLYLAL